MVKESGLGRVLIVDPNRLFAEAVGSFLAGAGTHIRLAGTAEDAVATAQAWEPALVLVDVGAPGHDLIPDAQRILESCRGAKVVAMAASGDPALIQKAARAGLAGYLAKAPPLFRFILSIREVAESRRFVTPRAWGGSPRAPRVDDPRFASRHLTPRERQVLALLARGQSTRGIAERLAISRNTARGHVQNVLMKLQVHSRMEAAAFAVKNGIVRPDEEDEGEPGDGPSPRGRSSASRRPFAFGRS